jgi:hypothetical protein
MYHKTSSSTVDRPVKINRAKAKTDLGYDQEWRSIGNFKSEVKKEFKCFLCLYFT